MDSVAKSAPKQEGIPVTDEAVIQARRTRQSAFARRNNVAGYLFISPWLIAFFVFTIIPIVASLYLAFTDYRLTAAPNWIGLDNFETMFFNDRRYWKSVTATFKYVIVAVPLRLVFALAVAIMLNNSRRLVSTYRAAYYAPSIIGGSVAVAVMWRRLLGADGLVNATLTLILGVPINTLWIGRPETAIWTLILLAIWQFGSPMLIFLAGLRQIPSELYESASIDGGSGWKKFLYITLPMLSPVIFFNLIIQMISGFLVFTQALIITNGGPLDTTLFYALYLYQRAFGTFQMGYGSAMAWVLLLIIAVFTALAFKFSTYWVFYEEGGY